MSTRLRISQGHLNDAVSQISWCSVPHNMCNAIAWYIMDAAVRHLCISSQAATLQPVKGLIFMFICCLCVAVWLFAKTGVGMVFIDPSDGFLVLCVS